MAIKQIFKSTLATCNYAFSDGKVAHFLDYKYITGNEKEIKELTDVIAGGSLHIYRDEKEMEIDTAADPMAEFKAKVIAEFLSAQEKATDPENDRGTSSPDLHLGAANSRTLDALRAASGGAGE